MADSKFPLGLEDITDSLHNRGYKIIFDYIPSGLRKNSKTNFIKQVDFKAFITSWNDDYKQEWKNYPTFGRMDDIRIYSKTSRKLNFDIEVPSASESEAITNFEKIQKLIQMSYPVFQEINVVPNQNSSKQTPIDFSSLPLSDELEDEIQEKIEKGQATPEEIKMLENSRDPGIYRRAALNLVTQSETNNSTVSLMSSPPFMKLRFVNWTSDTGLHGTIDGIKFSPDFTNNGFYSPEAAKDPSRGPVLVPKFLKLSISFNVLHVEKLGFGYIETKKDGNSPSEAVIYPRTLDYPYRAGQINSLYRSQILDKKDGDSKTETPPLSPLEAAAKFFTDFGNKLGSQVSEGLMSVPIIRAPVNAINEANKQIAAENASKATKK